MKKYFQLFIISWQNGLVYKTSLFLWRLRQFLSSIMALTIWSVIYSSNDATFGYDRNQMISYIFLTSVLQSIVLSTILYGLANRIYSGQLSNELVKPVNIYLYLAAQEAADKLKNFAFILVESGLLFILFRPSFILPSLLYFSVFLFLTFGAVLLHFFIQLIFGSLGFWSPDTWGPRFLFMMFIEFTAGKMFPLDILPQAFQNFVYFTPFPYLTFIQIQVFLGKVQPDMFLKHIAVLLVWLIISGAVALTVWSKGIKNYAAAGQ